MEDVQDSNQGETKPVPSTTIETAAVVSTLKPAWQPKEIKEYRTEAEVISETGETKLYELHVRVEKTQDRKKVVGNQVLALILSKAPNTVDTFRQKSDVFFQVLFVDKEARDFFHGRKEKISSFTLQMESFPPPESPFWKPVPTVINTKMRLLNIPTHYSLKKFEETLGSKVTGYIEGSAQFETYVQNRKVKNGNLSFHVTKLRAGTPWLFIRIGDFDVQMENPLRPNPPGTIIPNSDTEAAEASAAKAEAEAAQAAEEAEATKAISKEATKGTQEGTEGTEGDELTSEEPALMASTSEASGAIGKGKGPEKINNPTKTKTDNNNSTASGSNKNGTEQLVASTPTKVIQMTILRRPSTEDLDSDEELQLRERKRPADFSPPQDKEGGAGESGYQVVQYKHSRSSPSQSSQGQNTQQGRGQQQQQQQQQQPRQQQKSQQQQQQKQQQPQQQQPQQSQQQQRKQQQQQQQQQQKQQQQQQQQQQNKKNGQEAPKKEKRKEHQGTLSTWVQTQ